MEEQILRKKNPQPYLNKQINKIIPQRHSWSSKNQGKRDWKEVFVSKKATEGTALKF